jgi:ribosomal protein S18 acetylase RimI-like enzyme
LIAIYVEPAFKHQGIGSKLIEECETIAKSKDKSEIKLWVLEDNAIARAFYEKHGFELTDSKKKHEQLGVYEVRYEKHV